MSNEIISVIDHLCDKLGIAVDWTADNAMPMIQQLIEKYARYLLVNNIAWLCVWVAIMIPCVFMVVRLFIGGIKNEKWCADELWGFLWVLLLFASVTTFICAIVCMSQLIKAATIPEIYAAQELFSMLSNM